jgi:hypothetical protein
MACLALGQVAVIEIKVPDQGTVVKGCPIWRCPAATDQGASLRAAEILDLSPYHPNWLAP